MIDRAAETSLTSLSEEADDFGAAPLIPAVGFAAKHSFSNLKRFEFEREPAQANEVEVMPMIRSKKAMSVFAM
jgi:hypothetical protein